MSRSTSNVDKLAEKVEALLKISSEDPSNPDGNSTVDSLTRPVTDVAGIEDADKQGDNGFKTETATDHFPASISDSGNKGHGSSSDGVPTRPSSDDEDSYSYSSSSDDDQSDSEVYLGPSPPLVVHSPELPGDTRSIFALGRSPLDTVVEMIATGAAKNIIVMAGAGISTDAGIPDFRSPGTGLYDNLQAYNLPHPEAIFTLSYFKKNPKPFYVLAKELYPGQFVPTQSHFFVKLLAEKNVLRRHYTQNIDCLERVAGIDPELIVEAHGTFSLAHCINRRCKKEYSQEWVKERVFKDEIPRCVSCSSLVKPDITFFGEGLPARFFDLLESDFAACDLLVVMGTSLQVHPFASLVHEVAEHAPRLLINRMRVGEAKTPGMGFDFDGSHKGRLHRDALVLGDCDEACMLLAERLGWSSELAELRQKFVAERNLI